ncbi:MAG: glyoxylase-like metal-dependent hydrolase (beta-lactamase superfamily II) [Natronomonas sp.]|jgi:glyoxylase-like metal-dependent hydrolase (beta-lactamase superfamily II)
MNTSVARQPLDDPPAVASPQTSKSPPAESIGMPDDVTRFDMPRPDLPAYLTASPDEPIGCHLVGDTLFGTGYALSTDRLLRKLEAAGGVERVVVEHEDTDHYGALPGVVDRFDPEVVVPDGDQAFLRRAYADLAADRLVEDGDTVAGFRAVRVRGHTYGNMAFVDESRGVLVAGDTVVGADSDIAPDRQWSGPLAPPAELFNRDTDRARRNLVALAGLDVAEVLLTHGEDIHGGGSDAVDRLLRDLGLHWEL